MTKTSLLALLPLLVATACGLESEPLDRDDAVDLVVEELVDDSHPLVMFASDEVLPAGTKVSAPSSVPEDGDDPVPVVLDEPAWLVWIDDEPGALFGHGSRIVLVDADDGELEVIDAQWWPAIDDVRVFTDDYADPAAWVYPTVDDESLRDGVVAETDAAARCDGMRRGKALVINGWQEGETVRENFDANGTQMKALLENVGLETTYLAPEGTQGASGTATATTITPYMRQLERDLEAGDDFVLYLTGHGRSSENLGKNRIGPFWENDLEHWLSRLDPGVNVIVIVDGCHAGGMTDGLSCVADLVLTSTDTRTAWADLDEASGFDRLFSSIKDINNNDVGTEWTSSFIAGWNEILGTPAKLDAVEMSAQNASASFVEKLTSAAFDEAHKYDAAERAERTTPTKTRGAAKTRPGGVTYHTEGLACAPVDPTDPPDGCALAAGLQEAVGSMLALDDAAVVDLLCANSIELPTGNEVVYSDGVTVGTASGAVDVDFFGGIRSIALPGVLDLTCGGTANRLVLCDAGTPPPSGPFLVSWFTVDAPLQLENNEMFTQLGFVLDSNGDPADNYVPPPEWAGDFWTGADLAVEIAHDPSNGWGMSVLDLANGFAPLSAGVRVVMQGNAVAIAMPMDLFASNNPGARVSAFEHTGDWGQQGPWSGDVFPIVGDPLFVFPTP